MPPKQTTITATEAPPRNVEPPRFGAALFRPVDVRIETYVQRGQVEGWTLAWSPDESPNNFNELWLRRALRRYERWQRSLNKQRPRARHTGAQGVRLLICGQVVAAWTTAEELAVKPGHNGRSVNALYHPAHGVTKSGRAARAKKAPKRK